MIRQKGSTKEKRREERMDELCVLQVDFLDEMETWVEMRECTEKGWIATLQFFIFSSLLPMIKCLGDEAIPSESLNISKKFALWMGGVIEESV